MRYKFFTTSEKAWKAMFDAISGAKDSIYLEMYIFANDMVQYDFLLLLKKKAHKGLRVRIILDSFGSRGLDNAVIADLRQSGAELLFQSYFFHRAHRKILVVDEVVAFIGGVNISERFRFWNDLVVEVTGKKLLQSIISSFAKVYSGCGGKDPLCLRENRRVILDKTRAWIIEHFPARKNLTLKKIYKERIASAKEHIVFVTPYFMPKRWFIVALHQAVFRGVKVEILVPKMTNHFMADRVGYFFMFKLSRLGIDFCLQSKMNHAKAMIIDSKEAIVGSQNLDFLSFDWNSEIGVFLQEPEVIRELSHIVAGWRREASLFDATSYRPKWFDYILSPLITAFFRIL